MYYSHMKLDEKCTMFRCVPDAPALEHRWTNIVPFLFAFVADDGPIGCKGPPSFSKFGGVKWMMGVVRKGKSTTWTLKVDADSITAALGPHSYKTISVVAAFSEFQHEPLLKAVADDERPSDAFSEHFKGPPITIRSNDVRLTFDGTQWTVTQDRQRGG